MKITFLGTNGWFATKTGHTLCTIIETKMEYLILDAGSGMAFADKFIKKNKPIYLFISHMHLDHTVGLHYLNKFEFEQGINLIIPQKLIKPLKILVNEPYTLPPEKLRIKVNIIPSNKWQKLPIDIKSYPLLHSVECFGLRFKSENKTVAYASDTGLCPNIYKLSKNVDLIISECSYLPGERRPKWPHLNPQDAAMLARKSNAGRLALIHFDARRYETFSSRQTAVKAARKIFKNTFAPKDFDGITI
jgi:ribonuclease BN (tRNA processing enzyme)